MAANRLDFILILLIINILFSCKSENKETISLLFYKADGSIIRDDNVSVCKNDGEFYFKVQPPNESNIFNAVTTGITILYKGSSLNAKPIEVFSSEHLPNLFYPVEHETLKLDYVENNDEKWILIRENTFIGYKELTNLIDIRDSCNW